MQFGWARFRRSEDADVSQDPVAGEAGVDEVDAETLAPVDAADPAAQAASGDTPDHPVP
jgi:hypothetical protein